MKSDHKKLTTNGLNQTIRSKARTNSHLEAWTETAKQRLAEIETGQSEAISLKDVRATIKESLNREGPVPSGGSR